MKGPDSCRPNLSDPSAFLWSRGFLTACLVLLGHYFCLRGDALPSEVVCDGQYKGHLQGVALDEQFIYWSHTVTLVKSDLEGKLVKQVEVASHHGDLTLAQGKLYVAVELGAFNQLAGASEPWVYIYDPIDLRLLERIEVPQLVHGCGAISYHDDRFLLAGGLPESYRQNYLFEFDSRLNFIARHELASGYTKLGIQTLARVEGHWWLGCYGAPVNPGLLQVNDAFEVVAHSSSDFSYGIAQWSEGDQVMQGQCFEGRTRGKLVSLGIPEIDFEGHELP
jgi:hypothetical protein